MTSRAKRDNPERESGEATDEAQQEEGVRRIMKRLLDTPPQPQKAGKKEGAARRGRPKRREG